MTLVKNLAKLALLVVGSAVAGTVAGRFYSNVKEDQRRQSAI